MAAGQRRVRSGRCRRAALSPAWAGPRSARSRLKVSIHCAAGVVDGVGDEVGGVVVSAAGHADVGGGGAGGLAEEQVCAVDGLALCAVDGGGVGELDVGAGVAGGQCPRSAASLRRQAAVWSSMAVTVQRSRLATSRSRSLRRVATRSPSPTRSPAVRR